MRMGILKSVIGHRSSGISKLQICDARLSVFTIALLLAVTLASGCASAPKPGAVIPVEIPADPIEFDP